MREPKPCFCGNSWLKGPSATLLAWSGDTDHRPWALHAAKAKFISKIKTRLPTTSQTVKQQKRAKGVFKTP